MHKISKPTKPYQTKQHYTKTEISLCKKSTVYGYVSSTISQVLGHTHLVWIAVDELGIADISNTIEKDVSVRGPSSVSNIANTKTTLK